MQPSDVMLNYAPGHRLSVVLYLSQEVNQPANRDMEALTKELIAIALDHGGSFYLPYQQHYTRPTSTGPTPRSTSSSPSNAPTTPSCCS